MGKWYTDTAFLYSFHSIPTNVNILGVTSQQQPTCPHMPSSVPSSVPPSCPHLSSSLDPCPCHRPPLTFGRNHLLLATNAIASSAGFKIVTLGAPLVPEVTRSCSGAFSLRIFFRFRLPSSVLEITKKEASCQSRSQVHHRSLSLHITTCRAWLRATVQPFMLSFTDQ